MSSTGKLANVIYVASFFTFCSNNLNHVLEYRVVVQKFAALFNQSNWKRHTGIIERAKVILLRVGVE